MSDKKTKTVRIQSSAMSAEFIRVLLKYGFQTQKAKQCAEIFLDNTLEGVASHGVNRFARFINYVRNGHIIPGAEPVLKQRSANIEQWDGNLGPGPLNAVYCTNRAMELAGESGLGCVALANTNHWMRGGTYGRMAAEAGFAMIAWTNTTANMPAWGALDQRLGNNPLVIAVPKENGPVVLDMAMTQYSYGRLESMNEDQELELPGGYDSTGRLTGNPKAVLETGRILPAGYWKGSALALMLDLLAALLSGGDPTAEISKRSMEYGVSQVFIAINLPVLGTTQDLAATVNDVLSHYMLSIPADPEKKVRYPGENAAALRQDNLENGIMVSRAVWDNILTL